MATTDGFCDNTPPEPRKPRRWLTVKSLKAVVAGALSGTALAYVAIFLTNYWHAIEAVLDRWYVSIGSFGLVMFCVAIQLAIIMSFMWLKLKVAESINAELQGRVRDIESQINALAQVDMNVMMALRKTQEDVIDMYANLKSERRTP